MFMCMNDMVILGGSGYIGSVVRTKAKCDSIDIGWYSNSKKWTDNCDYNNLTTEFIQQYKTVVVLAGHSSVLMCKGDFNSTYNNNIRNFGNLLSKITDRQKLVYASSSSIYNGYDGIATEDFNSFIGTNEYDISKYTIDLMAKASNKNFYALRFGTVNGYSENMRWELMMNKMVVDAITLNTINVFNGNIQRPICFIDTISDVINILNSTDKDVPGIYNICNMNDNIMGYANTVKRIVEKYTNLKIDVIDNGSSPTYNFSMSNKKFSETFNYEFSTDVDSVIKKLITSDKIEGHRNDRKIYS